MSIEDISVEKLGGPVIDRRTTLQILGAAGLASIAGCLGGDDTEPEESDSEELESTESDDRYGGTLIAGWSTEEIPRLDIARETEAQISQLALNLYSAPLKVTGDYEIIGDLAEDWYFENDGETLVFEFRDDVVFHNGDEFTASDMVYSINRTLDLDSPYADRYEDIKEMETPDDYTLRIHTDEPLAPILVFMTRGLGRGAVAVNERVIEDIGNEAHLTAPIGTGPFRLADFDDGTQIVLERNEEYYDTDEEGNQLPYLDEVIIDPIPETSTLIGALQTGDIQFANSIPAGNVQELEGADNVVISRKPGPNWFAIALNTTREPFDSPQVRRGIAKLINNEDFIRDGDFGEGEPARGPIPPAIEWASRDNDEKNQAQAYDPEEGLRILEEEGAADASFEILSSETFERWVRTVRSQLLEEAPDLDIEIRQVQQADYFGIKGDLDYDVAVAQLSSAADPDQALWNFYRQPEDGGAWNETGYSPETADNAEEVNELLGQQRRETDEQRRFEILAEVEDLVIEDCVDVYLNHANDIMVYSNSVQGFQHPPQLCPFETVWLE